MKNIFYDEKENKIDYEKIKHKMRVSRNEFKVDGKFDIPIIKRQGFDTKGIKTMSYTKTKMYDFDNLDRVIQFFTYDWKFENVL